MSIKYFIKRIIVYLILVFSAITINFIIPRLIPGNPFAYLLRQMRMQGAHIQNYQEIIESYKRRFGLDKDLFTQYIMYLQNLMRGDLGPSLMAFPMTVQQLIMNALPWTIGLLSVSTIVGWLLGVLLGTFISMKRETKINSIIVCAFLGLSQIPYYLLALLLIFALVYVIPLFPASGGYSPYVKPGFNISFIGDVIYHSILPALSLILISLGGWMIEMRGVVTNVLGEDYILFAEAKGLKKNIITLKYVFRNALLPEVTGLAMSLGYVMSGALLLEMIFAYPGVGRLYMNALNRLDYNVMQGVFLIVTLAVLTATLIIDLIYPLIDPRIGYEK